MFHEYPIDKDIVLSLTNIEFINEVYTLNVELYKLNHSMQSIDTSYEQIRTAFIENNIDINTYKLNIKAQKEKYKEINKFLLTTKDDLVRLLSISRILTKSSPLLSKIITVISQSKYPDDFNSLLDIEIRKLNQEIEENAQRSQNRIKKTKGN